MKFNKKRFIIYIMTITAALTIGGCVLLLTITFYKPSSPPVLLNSQTESYKSAEVSSYLEIQDDEDYLYCVKLENGKIVVYKKGETTPFETLDTDPTVLPNKDREDLIKGIHIKTEKALKRLIEDFDG